jgi:hypothetical protein
VSLEVPEGFISSEPAPAHQPGRRTIPGYVGVSTKVLSWDGLLWYPSAIAFTKAIRQYWGCVGKICALHLHPVLLSLQHPPDAIR